VQAEVVADKFQGPHVTEGVMLQTPSDRQVFAKLCRHRSLISPDCSALRTTSNAMNQVAGEENATRQGQMLQQGISEGVLMVAVDWRQRNPVRLSVEGMVLRITIRGLGPRAW
jgi:hypothetical protein